VLIAQGKLRALAGEPQSNQRGSDFRRRAKRLAGNFQNKLRARVQLRDDREIAVRLAAGFGGKAAGNFCLHDEMHLFDVIRDLEEAMKNRRRDVVGEISVNEDAAARGERHEIGFQNIPRDDMDIRKLLRKLLQSGCERGVELDGMDGETGGSEVRGHFAVTRANFHPARLRGKFCGNGRVWRNANGASDLFAPVNVRKKMLPQPLPSH